MPKSSVCQDAVKFASFSEFGIQFEVKALCSLGELALVSVLSWGLARACEIAPCTNLLVFPFAIVHD